MWASVSPDEKTVVFARGHNLYLMDAENYAKALKKSGDTSVVETQLTTDGVGKYSYARVLLPEQEEQLKKQDKGDTNKAGPRTPAITTDWSKDSKKFALERNDDRKVGDYWKWLLGSSDTGADVLELQREKQTTPSKKFKE